MRFIRACFENQKARWNWMATSNVGEVLEPAARSGHLAYALATWRSWLNRHWAHSAARRALKLAAGAAANRSPLR